MSTVNVEEEIERLRQSIEAINKKNKRERKELTDRIDELETELDDLQSEYEALQDQLDFVGDITQEKTTKEQKIAAIVQYAKNQYEKDGRGAVKVKPKTITGLVNISRRYAYDLIDDMTEQYTWAYDPESLQQYGELEKTRSQRGVVIDFEGVHGDPVDVNLFTTPIEETPA